MYQRALLGYNKDPPPNAKPQLNLFYNMGVLSRDLQEFKRAKEYFDTAYQGCQELLGPQHALASDALDQLNIEIERNTPRAGNSDG